MIQPHRRRFPQGMSLFSKTYPILWTRSLLLLSSLSLMSRMIQTTNQMKKKHWYSPYCYHFVVDSYSSYYTHSCYSFTSPTSTSCTSCTYAEAMSKSSAGILSDGDLTALNSRGTRKAHQPFMDASHKDGSQSRRTRAQPLHLDFV